MEKQLTLKIENLTDEQVLREFVKRFDCDGAILVYKSDEMEAGFGRWSNQSGRKWVNGILKTLKQAT